MDYDYQQIAHELNKTAQHRAYHRSSLLAAKDIEGITDLERRLLDRFLEVNLPSLESRLHLQYLATKIANMKE